MSRHLPPNPNLDHLRKQAKDLLHDTLQHTPSAKLADAQHAIAREYGFASWPKLKAHVESSAGAELKPNPFVGHWTADLSRSTPHPGNPFRRAWFQIEVVGETVLISDAVVNDAGHEDRGTNTIRVDKVEHPSERGDGYALTATWRGTHVLETVATKEGQVLGWGVYEVSADGTTLTVSADQQRIVLAREEVPAPSPE